MYPGFGKASGPTGPPGSQPLFGNLGGGRPPSPSPPTTPPFSGAAPLRSPSRGPEAPGQLYSLPLGFERVRPAASQPFPSAGVYRRPESSGQLHSPPLAFERARPAASHPHPSAGVHRSTESHPTWDHGQRSSFKNYDTQAHQRPSAVTSFVVSRNSGTSVTAKVSRFQDTEGIRSPPFLSKDVNFRNSTQGAPRSHLVAPRIRSPPLVSYEDLHPSVGVEEPSVSSVGFNTRSNTNFSTPDSRVHQKSLQSASNTISEAAAGNATNIPVAKRTRSPPLLPEDQVFHGNSHATQDGTEREMQAKAKRLARFKVELSKTPQNNPDNVEPGVSANRHEQSNVERNKLAAYKSTELAMGGSDGNALPEDEGVESSGIIIGLCPDMCPESERAERERKGDLDQYERLDGDRNQTSMSLAVKKYNRTAERDANLIRPMPILQKTIDYLLNLLDQPYNDRFLRIYNFLWDRMRAIRMDLRMQHIFNQEAITMLEQMIRLHIIVMHELCEYSRGEGFAEGFDAHLNIEQMNKTSVELFQLYDDHRKKGINIPTEKEFRGYYALLKLDKHPGYMVEPAELSLDLAKMTPEIRQTSEVLFARDVARACRTGNFIAFFRLARKASYLQSCLMHAHFSKLRTQALASIHAGLQNNQGLPIADGAKWLAMEEDEIESLSEYHGFVIKSFQEPYIVKEGPFLNGDEDYPTKCSKLVDMKKSRRIVEDVLASSQVIPSSSKPTKKTQLTKSNKPEPKTISYVEKKSPVRRAPAIRVTKPLHEVDEEMPNFEAFSPPKDARQKQQMFQVPIFSSPEDSRQKQQTIQTPIFGQYSEDSPKVAAVSPSPWGFSSFTRQPDKVGTIEKRNYDVLFSNSPERSMHSGMERMPLQIESKTSVQEKSVGIYSSGKEYPDIQIMVTDNLEGEEPSDLHQIDENNDVMESSQQEEIAEAKLKLILRLWKRRALKLRQLREKKQLAANAALNSLSLGPPIQLKTDQPSTSGEFDIDLVLRERFKNHGRSWSRLNVSDVIADILGTRNPDARCLFWKTVVCSQMNNLEGDDLGQRSHFLGAAPWLLSKLMPSENDADNDDEDLVVSSPGVSIWKKWVRGQAGSDLNCYLSVVKDASFDNLSQSVSGASAVLFLTSESISWNLQKVRLHNLLMLIPYGSCLPLLILSGSYKNNVDDSTIVDNLGLRDLDKSRISSFLVVPLVESQQMGQLGGFFSDNQLREGLRWLASESPLQPILHHVKTLELVLTHLNSSLEPLDRMKDYEAGPDNCILAFNEALDWSQKEIAAAVKSNPSSWPCPEIALLEEFSDEYRVVKWCLPSVGWSSAEKVEPLMSALGDCRLPAFPDHISWLPQCCNAGKEIENLRGELENGLIEYLTNSSKMMGLALAIKEAHVMLQRSCRLQRHDSCCYIVPNWVMIFRRIFNWRLMGLANGASSSAYVLESPHLNAVFENLGKLGLEDAGPSPCYLNQPSLDEIIEVGRAPLSSHRGQPLVESGVAVPETSPNGEIHETPNTTDWMEDERSLAHDGQAEIENVSHENGRLENAGGEMVVTGEVGKGAEKLSILLEQCNMLQNVIDEKLSIFF